MATCTPETILSLIAIILLLGYFGGELIHLGFKYKKLQLITTGSAIKLLVPGGIIILIMLVPLFSLLGCFAA